MLNHFILLLKNSKLFVQIEWTIFEIYVAIWIFFFKIRGLWTLQNLVFCYHILLRDIKFYYKIKIYVFISYAFTFLTGQWFLIPSNMSLFLIKLCPTVELNVFFRPMPTHSHNITIFQTGLIQYRYRSLSNTYV